MTPGARLAAAVDVLEDVVKRHRPIATALADWGKAHRFAGSGDRAMIGNIVYDAMRQRRSAAARMQADTPRALVLGVAAGALGRSPAEVAALCDGAGHALGPLTEAETHALMASSHTQTAADTNPGISGDIPDWLVPHLTAAFGPDRVVEEGRAFAARAPLDVRVNTLKATREKVLDALSHTGASPTPWSPVGVRVPAASGSRRLPKVEAEAAHGRGWFEVQDESSQIAACLAGAGPREQVLDLCAGAGGKTLALGAAMQNTGQIHAYDRDKMQLRPIFDRLKRADLRNVQTIDGGDAKALDALGDRFDLVFVDAPCSGSGTWRRRPDAKWRLTAKQLGARIK
ncbi:MAG: RsmB/NOP family class I SAM-dependent RNA methyltransferase, partial [Pseudomonadota bacterium]